MTGNYPCLDQSSNLMIYDSLNEADYNRIALLIRDQVGIKLLSVKKLMVEGRLRKRARSAGFNSLLEYCNYLFNESGLSKELVHIINAVTTNKTDFFRETEHFNILRNRIIPELLGHRRASSNRKIKLWSAASSNGAEAYTIAMVMADIAALNNTFQFFVLGTDISTNMLAEASIGVYPKEMIQPVPLHLKNRYIMYGHSKNTRDQVRIVPELRRLVRFERLNLMDHTYPIDRDVDVIFLRNVLIYFDRETQDAVVNRMAKHLSPGGFLILGSSESMIGASLKFRQWAPGIFQKVSV